jgi:hypothetical protein
MSDIDPHQIATLAIPFVLIGLVATVVLVIPYWFIFKKAGFSPWLAILMFVPLANIIILYVVAFSQWKVVPAMPYSVTQFPHEPYPPQNLSPPRS